jgi:pyruvate ferredoxin oxidoreductase alpha subunit
VCMDGFVLTHAYERIDLPTQEQIDRYLPAFRPRQLLDPADPVTIGALVGPEAFTEVRYLAHTTQMRALERIPDLAAEFESVFGRAQDGLLSLYRCADADTVVVALGSVLGTVKDAVDELRADGVRVGVLGLTTFRPFPATAVRAALADIPRVVVLERAFAVGVGGIVSADLDTALAGSSAQRRYTVIAGLGGRPITRASLRQLILYAAADALDPLTFLDLDRAAVAARTR